MMRTKNYSKNGSKFEMKNRRNLGYIHIIGEKEHLTNSEIKSFVNNTLTSRSNGFICTFGKNNSGKTDFLYGKKYGDNYSNIISEESRLNSNFSELPLVEKFTQQLFLQANKIKNYFQGRREKKMYFFRIKCSFVLVKHEKDVLTCPENIYDVFQGLNNSLDITNTEDECNFNILQIDIQEPIQILNMIKIARKLQFEKISQENLKFHTLFIFEIESVFYKLNSNNCSPMDQVIKYCNKVFILDVTGSETNCVRIYSEKMNLEEFIKELIFILVRNFLISKSHGSLFLLNTVLKGIFDTSFISILFFRFNGLNVIINKMKEYFKDDVTSNSNFQYKFCIEPLNNNSLISTFDQIRKYSSYLKNMCLKMGSEYIIESFNSQDFEITNIFENLIALFYNLNGYIVNYEDILINIENIENLIIVNKSNTDWNHFNNSSIEYKTISEYINNWCNEYLGNYNPNCQFFEDNNFVPENDHNKNNKFENSILESDSIQIPFKKTNGQYEYEIDNCYYSSNCPNKFNNSVIGIKDELVEIFSKKQGFNLKNNRRVKSCINISFSTLSKSDSIASFSKILLAVNTARRRVREYRKKQQTKTNCFQEKINNNRVYFENKQERNIFWNKTLLKCPVFSYEKNYQKISSKISKISPSRSSKKHDHKEFKENFIKETKDVEIQVDIQETYHRGINDKKIDLRCVQVDINENNIEMGSSTQEGSDKVHFGTLENTSYASDSYKEQVILPNQNHPGIKYIDNNFGNINNLNNHVHMSNSNTDYQRWVTYQRVNHRTFFYGQKTVYPIFNSNFKYSDRFIQSNLKIN